jgi:hypothetical protein
MPNLQQAKIYKIVCNTTGLTYYGSTTQQTLSMRLTKHRNNYKNFLNGKYNYVTSYKIIENNNYDIFLVESVQCDTKDQLHARERFWIESNQCVNKNIPARSRKEWYQRKKQIIANGTKPQMV